MSCQWQAPCGCIIEFEGQVIDKGQPIKAHKARCARHDRAADYQAAADAAFDDCKFKEQVRAKFRELFPSVTDPALYYERTGALRLATIAPLKNGERTTLAADLAAAFGAGKVEIV